MITTLGWSGGWPVAGGSSGGTGLPTSGGTYRIVPRHSGKAVDVQNCGTGNGTNVQQLVLAQQQLPEMDLYRCGFRQLAHLTGKQQRSGAGCERVLHSQQCQCAAMVLAEQQLSEMAAR